MAMFLFRAAFWLVVGFMLVAPHGTDFGSAAASFKEQAVTAGLQAGQKMIVSQIIAAPVMTVPAISAATAGIKTPVTPRLRPAALG
jgi:hypothetical protein